MPELAADGKLSSFNDRPLSSIEISPTQVMSFSNMTLGKTLKSMDIKTLFDATDSYEEIIEDADHPNLVYDRVFHFWTMSNDDSSRVFGPYYVPYIDETSVVEDKTKITIRPLREVINPRFVRLSDTLYVMFFFSNFSTNQLPDDKYTDDPKYLMRTPEFATNYPERIGSSSASAPSLSSSSISVGKDNIPNYYDDSNGVYVSNPRCALCSCIIRMSPVEIGEIYDPPDQGGGVYRIYPIAERPTIVNWVGMRYAHDFYPSLLVNRVQDLSWMASNDGADGYVDAATEVPGKAIPPHHLINGVEGKMYPGFTGYDFDTIPINNVFKDSLNYILEIERIGQDAHDPEYCTYYNNFRPDVAEHRITKVEWKTVRAPELTLTNRGWDHNSSSYANSLNVEYQYPYEDSKTDTWFVVLSIQYEAVPITPYDILKYKLCACNKDSSSSSSSSSSGPPCDETIIYYVEVTAYYDNIHGAGDCVDDTVHLVTSSVWPEYEISGGQTCDELGFFNGNGAWGAEIPAMQGWYYGYCDDSCSGYPSPPPPDIINTPTLWAWGDGGERVLGGVELITGVLDCTTGERIQSISSMDFSVDQMEMPNWEWGIYEEWLGACFWDRIGNWPNPLIRVYEGQPSECYFPYSSECPCMSSSSSAGPTPPPPSSSSSSGGAIPPPTPIPIEELFFADLSSDGYLSPYMGRPFEPLDTSSSYKMGFFNEMVYIPIQPLEFTQGDGIFTYEEDLSSVSNLPYDRVLHFYMTSGSSGRYIDGPYYVPYVDTVTALGNKSKITLKPLREVINPRFQKLNDETYVMYFFTNFTEEVAEYTDDPNKMKRMLEFATNFPSDLFASGSQPSSSARRAPEDNTLNYYATGGATEITEPKCALCSCIIRISNFEITLSTSGSSSSATKETKNLKYPIAEKPTIVNWVGDRFASDFVQPLLINTTQRVDWSSNKQETDTLDNEAITSNPQRQIEYYSIVNKLEAKMYPGYTGLNLGVRPIVDIYGDSLYHVFVLSVSGTDKYFLEVNPDVIFSTPTNIMSYEWEHLFGSSSTSNAPGLKVEDDPSEDTPNAKTNTHYVVMRLKTSSSVSAMLDYCDK